MIYPKCKDNKQIYMSADGQILPCCMVSSDGWQPRKVDKWHTENFDVQDILDDIRKWASDLEKNKSEQFLNCSAECGSSVETTPTNTGIATTTSPRLYPSTTHIELTRRCTLKCPKCPRTIALDLNKDIKIGDLEYEKVVKFIDGNIEKNNDTILLCGSFGDPIFYPRLKDIITYIDSLNKTFVLATAAPAKNKEWWNNFFDLYKKPASAIIFGLDGLDDTSHLYRIGTDHNYLFEIMKLGVSKGKRIIWQFIPFKFNEHQIEDAKKIAQDNGFEFRIRLGDRWEKDDPLRPEKLYESRSW